MISSDKNSGYRSKVHRVGGRFLVLAGLAALLAGCASVARPQLAGIRCERVSSDAVLVTSVEARAAKDGGILVQGDVRTKMGFPAPVQSHLDVYALDDKGNKLADCTTQYFPRPIPRLHYGFENHANYSVEIKADPAVVKTVRVEHHQVALNKCDLPPEVRN